MPVRAFNVRRNGIYFRLHMPTFLFLYLQSQFKFAAESDAPLSSQEKKVPSHHPHPFTPPPIALLSVHRVKYSLLCSSLVQILFDGRLSNIIVFSYNAKAVDGQLCLEASPNENQTFFAHSPHATLLEVRVIIITIIIRS